MKRITELNHTEAQKFFLKEKSYFNFDLPVYFNFAKILKLVSDKLKDKKLSQYYKTEEGKILKPEQFENVNYTLLSNKSGQYAWRPLQLIHPVLYTELVRVITAKGNWNKIIENITNLKNSNIECVSLPFVSDSAQSDKAEQVRGWWQEIEQKSIDLGLDFEYLYHTDITNCYASIYTHSIAWALHGKEEAKKERFKNNLIGNKIDKLLQAMSFGQTNGIPQGSVLMDFIAELILCYADKLLKEKITDIEDYKIIRYRDDYRIFTNNPQIAENIIKNLTEVLAGLGLSLSDAKTVKSNNIIKDAIKPDKLYWEVNNNLNSDQSLQSQLYIINNLAEKYPNSGTLSKELQIFFEKLNKKKKINENIHVLVSLISNIAFKNPRVYPVATAIISKLINGFTGEEKKKIIQRIQTRFNKLPNTGHLQIWLQRLTIKIDDSIKYEEKLCKKVDSHDVVLFCSEWLKDDFKNSINDCVIIDRDKIDKLDSIIGTKEVALFKLDYYS